MASLELSWDANFQPKPHGDVAGKPLAWKMARMVIPRKIAHVIVIATAVPTEPPLVCAAIAYLQEHRLPSSDDKFLVAAT